MCISSAAILNLILINRRLANEFHQDNQELIIDRQLFNENNWLFKNYFHISILFSYLFRYLFLNFINIFINIFVFFKRYFFYLARNLTLVITTVTSVAIIKLSSDKNNDYVQNKYFYSLFGYLIVSFTLYIFLQFFESLKKN